MGRLHSRCKRDVPSGLRTSLVAIYPGRRGLGRGRPGSALPWAVLGEAFSLAGRSCWTLPASVLPSKGRSAGDFPMERQFDVHL